MQVTLLPAKVEDYRRIHAMQVRAFAPLLQKYRDYDTNPGAESSDRVLSRLLSPDSTCHLIIADGVCVGMIRVQACCTGEYRISPLFVLPEHQGKGVAQAAVRAVFDMYTDAQLWTLDTILEEESLCRFYEKLGFKRSDYRKKIQDHLTLVGYERRMNT